MALQDYNILKAMTKEQLMDIVPDGFTFYTDPWLHQIVAFIACIANDQFYLALDLGTGKTKVSIDAARYLKSIGKEINAIVLCLDAAVEKWVDEINTHSSEFTGIALKNMDKKERLEALFSKDYNFKCISFESFRYTCAKRVPNPKKKGKNMEVVDMDIIDKISNHGFTMFIADESHRLKSRKALVFKVCDLISQKIKYRYLLTGTPFNKPIDIWTQYFLLDRGKTFGNNFFMFRKKHFKEKMRYIKRLGYEIPDYIITAEGKKFIMDKMYSMGIRYDEDEIKDMPGKVFNKIEFELSPEQKKDYRSLVSNFKDLKSVVGENKSMVYRQICSGFILKAGKIYKKNPKLDILMELLVDIVDKDKVVIFHNFDEEHESIGNALKKAKIKYVKINGSTKDKWVENQKFLKKNKHRVAIVNIKSGSASIDLQIARYAFFFSNSQSIIDRKQASKRIHRGSIKRTRYYYDIIARGTIDESIHKALKKGINLFDEIMDGKKFKKILEGKL